MDWIFLVRLTGDINIAEGSHASATSKKTELKLDYEDFLRQRGLTKWERENPLRQALINRRRETADDAAARVVEEAKRSGA